ncbi:helix-turn-helix domain-containing protein [Pedobacter sp. UBA4863]|uniref:helix-turn-helix domain-containing protein n=1 Tax=Pedobacter sp. UBA4863 TaxID=1947060 RepID=UPI0025CEFEC1|nr:helix-turn-helix transcriptional regulator [Pedobacter sp. UBA4863]
MEKKDAILRRLGERIRQIRKEKGITQGQLAYSIDKDQQSIQRLEKGNVNPSLYYLCEIADGLGVEISYLLGGQGR